VAPGLQTLTLSDSVFRPRRCACRRWRWRAVSEERLNISAKSSNVSVTANRNKCHHSIRHDARLAGSWYCVGSCACWCVLTHWCPASCKKDTNLIADIKIHRALMGYTTGDAYAALNKHLAAMNLHRTCFDCNG